MRPQRAWPDLAENAVHLRGRRFPDRSIELLEALIDREFPQLKEQISIIRKPVNEGLPQARKTGVAAATGDYIMHVDSDDWIEADAAEKRVGKAESEDADVVCFFAWKKLAEGERKLISDKEFSSPQALAQACFVHKAHPSVALKLWRRSLFSPEIFFPRFGQHEDMVQTLQLLGHASKVALLPEPLYHYRKDNAGAMTKSRRAKRRLQSLRNYLDLCMFYRANPAASPIAGLYKRILRKARLWTFVYDRGARKEYPELF